MDGVAGEPVHNPVEDEKDAGSGAVGASHRHRGRSGWSALRSVAAYLGLVLILGLHRLVIYYHFPALVCTEGEAGVGGGNKGVTAETVCNPVEDERKQGLEQGLEEELDPELEELVARHGHGQSCHLLHDFKAGNRLDYDKEDSDKKMRRCLARV